MEESGTGAVIAAPESWRRADNETALDMSKLAKGLSGRLSAARCIQ